MTKSDIKQAEYLIKEGLSHHDAKKVQGWGYDHEVIRAMEKIFSNVIMIRMYNLSNAAVKYYSREPKPPMTISEMRGYMHETSQLMLSDGIGLGNSIYKPELDYAVQFTIYEECEDE